MNYLVVDDEADLIEIHELAIDLADSDSHIFRALNVTSAIELLQKEKIDLIICDYRMPEQTGDKLQDWAIANCPQIPFVLCSGNALKECAGIIPEKLFAYINKPDIMDGDAAMIQKLLDSKKNFPSPSTASPLNFQSVRVRTLMVLDVLPVDLFVKLSELKYVKFWGKDEALTDEDRSKMNAKGPLLWLQASDVSIFSKTFEKTLLSLAEGKRPKGVLSEGDEFASYLKEAIPLFQASAEVQKAASIWISSSMNLLKNTPNIGNKLNELLNSKSGYAQHVNLVTMIGLELLRLTSWSGEAVYFKISTAALFHDITLNINEDSELTMLEKSDLKHSTSSAEFVRTMRDLPPDVDRMILDHHERPLGDGFPRGLLAKDVSPLQSVFNLAHEIADYYQTHAPASGKLKLKEVFELIAVEWREKGHYKKLYQALAEKA